MQVIVVQCGTPESYPAQHSCAGNEQRKFLGLVVVRVLDLHQNTDNILDVPLDLNDFFTRNLGQGETL
jgi:hypothetical protein